MKTLLSSLVISLLFSSSLAFAAADKITIKVDTPLTITKISMTDPSGKSFWYDIGTENPWVWKNKGDNVESFGIKVTYSIVGPQDANNIVVIDPTKMEGEQNVNIGLQQCTNDENLYKLTVSESQGVTLNTSGPQCD